MQVEQLVEGEITLLQLRDDRFELAVGLFEGKRLDRSVRHHVWRLLLDHTGMLLHPGAARIARLYYDHQGYGLTIFEFNVPLLVQIAQVESRRQLSFV